MRKKGLIFSIVIIIVLVFGVSFLDVSVRHKLLQNPLLQQFTPAYHSLRKLADLPFIIFTFRATNLPEYRLQISPNNISRLNALLPDNPYGGAILNDSNKVWVGADFGGDKYNDRVKVRYRGNLANHWNAYKKSYAVSFPDENLFSGMKELDLIIPYDRRYFVETLNIFRAKRLGLLVQEPFFVRLNINGNDMGVYLAAERWGQEWLEKKGVPSNSALLGVLNQKEVLVDIDPDATIYDRDGTALWKSWNSESEVFQDQTKFLAELVSHATDREFENLLPYVVDMDTYYAWNITLLLSGHYHGGDGDDDRSDNLVMLLDGSTGKLRPIPYNSGISAPSDVEPSVFTKRVLSIDSFKAERDRRLQEYLENEENVRAEEEFISEWNSRMRKEFYSDNAKLHTNFKFISEINESERLVAENREAAKGEFDKDYRVYFKDSNFSGLEDIPDSFTYLEGLASGEDRWLLDNPQFSIDSRGLVLRTGSYFFSNDVIVPTGNSLTIERGVNITMAKGKSFISFRPVKILGEQYAPVRISGNNWGVFGIISKSEEESIIKNALFEGGGETQIGGANFTGMLSIYDGRSRIEGSTFLSARGDDALNVKGGFSEIENNIFDNNISDAIDLDFPDPNTVVFNNSFNNGGGDAIDLSFSNVEIRGNNVSVCGDKGISVGELSNPVLSENTIEGCNIGIAIKDKSEAEIRDNFIRDNRVGIALYQKKEIFGGGRAVILRNKLIDNKKDFELDSQSKLINEQI